MSCAYLVSLQRHKFGTVLASHCASPFGAFIPGSPMTTITLDQLKETLADVVREALSNGQTVLLPGLGTLRVEHKPSEMIEDENGQVVMRPPRDEVVFDPDVDQS